MDMSGMGMMGMSPMGMGMGGDDSGSMAPLNHTGVDFTDPDQASDFLSSLLDDTVLQVVGETYAVYFWFGILVVLFLATAYNVTRWLTLKTRLRYASANRATPAKPKSPLHRALATVSAIGREVTYPQWTPLRAAWWVRIPPVGVLVLVVVHFAYVIALEFVGVDPAVYGDQYYMALSVKAAWLAIAQVPLLILLAGKNNLVGLLTGVSYERLNVLHRWTSRVLLLLATVHFGTANFIWNQFGLMQLEWSTDACPPTGMAAYALLLWLNLSTLAPLRNLSYEFFVVQHILTFFGFIIALMLHLPTTALTTRNWIYAPIALFLFDRLVRTGRYVWHNVRGSSATLEEMPGGVTRVRVSNKQVKKWTPGSFVLLSLPRLSPGQSHPATIASTPTSHDGDLVFLLRSHKGFTSKLARVASVDSAQSDEERGHSPERHSRRALVDGPYGQHSDFAAYDTTVLIAGATGVTFTLPILLDIAERATSRHLPVRRIVFVWMVKSYECVDWIRPELLSVLPKLRAAGIDISIRVCVTCDPGATGSSDNLCPDGGTAAGCQCDTKLGPCCCVALPDDASSHSNRNSAADEERPTEADRNESGATIVTEKAEAKTKDIDTTSGRPDLPNLLWDTADLAEGEMSVVVCGPLGLQACSRMAVAQLSDSRAVHKGSGAQGIHLHVEGFAF